MSAVLISGALANKPFNAGNAWSRLGWILGFRRLGFDVMFVEQIGRESCIDATGKTCRLPDSVNAKYFREVMAEFGLSQNSALLCIDDIKQSQGVPLPRVKAFAERSELLFNFGGHLTNPTLKELPRRKVYYDDDPGFTQFWYAQNTAIEKLAGHDHYFTVGQNVGSAGCEIPCGDIDWKHTRPPVVLDQWPAAAPGKFNRFTTVASWRGAFGPVQFSGQTYGLKVHEFRRFLDLPARSRKDFEIALDIHPADVKDRHALANYGWHLVDPRQVAGSPSDYRNYVQTSGAEFSVAQAIYVKTRSGWVSDRTVRYLSSGRPALIQDTGLGEHFPTAKGLVIFSTMEEAMDGAANIVDRYEEHCAAARKIAEDHFDSDKVISELLVEVGLELPQQVGG